MAIKAIESINEVRTLLGDTSGAVGTQYLVVDLLKYLNEGQKEIVKIDLQANATRESVKLDPGPKQVLPAGSLGLIKVVKNMGSTGTTVGEIVRRIERKILDTIRPDWPEATAKAITKYFIYDPIISRNTYDIYPPATSTVTQYLEIIHGELPDIITNTATEEILDDRYYADLIDYMLFRAKSMHKEYAGEAGEAIMHLQKFEASVAGKA